MLDFIYDASDADIQIDDCASEPLFYEKDGLTSYRAALMILRKMEYWPAVIYDNSIHPVRLNPPIRL